VASSKGLNLGLELKVTVTKAPKGDDKEEVADGEEKELLEDKLVRLQCGGRQENSLRTVCSDL
jgi:hypothetical protein